MDLGPRNGCDRKYEDFILRFSLTEVFLRLVCASLKHFFFLGCGLALLIGYCKMEALHAMSLQPGFGFHPTDVELISHYLKKKILGQKFEYEIIPEVDIYKHEPWDLPGKCKIPTRDSKWHFFASRDRKYPNGSRSNRATKAGYWKSTGKDRTIKDKKRTIGTKKTLVFHEGRPPSGRRTEWIMHEYYIDEKECKSSSVMKDAFVLCRVTKRTGWSSEDDNQVDNSDSHPEQLNDVVESVISAEAGSPTPDGEELQAMLEELFDPEFGIPKTEFGIPSTDDQNAETSNLQNITMVAPKVEARDAYPNQNVADDADWLLPEDIYTILCPGTDDFSTNIFQDPSEQAARAFPDEAYYMLPNKSPFTVPRNLSHENEKELQENMENNVSSQSSSCNDYNEIVVRRRRVATSSTSVCSSIGRAKLQVGINKMVTSNSESINQTVEFVDSRGYHLTANVEDQKKHVHDNSSLDSSNLNEAIAGSAKQPGAANTCKLGNGGSKPEKVLTKSPPCPESSHGQRDVTENTRCIQGFLRGLVMVLRDCSSAGLNILFFSACMMGTVALLLYFLLRDGRRILGGFPFIGL